MSEEGSMLIAYLSFFFISIILLFSLVNLSDKINTLSDNKYSVYTAKGDSLDVYIQDQTTFPFDIYAHTIVNETTLASSVSINSYNILVSDSTGASAGMAIDIISDNFFFQSLIKSVVGNNITLASPIDADFKSGATVNFGEWDFSLADGSVTPIFYYVKIPNSKSYDFYTMTLNIEDNSVIYDSTFGGLSALSNGLIARAVDGASKTFFIITTNGGFRENGFDVFYGDKVPSGTYSFSAIKNIREVNGVALRLNGANNDYLEFIVQDDLTELNKMAISVHGHEVEN